ncbi:MAG: HD domain-containing protein [Lachnospiraceae bacterium]|nr:HD domain-containing protein [Lachnospiraceae bacterium]
MIRKKIEDLVGNEILSKPLMTFDYQIILPEGARLRPDYIERLKTLGVTDVWVLEEYYDETDALIVLKDNILSSVSQNVKDILERHTYQNNEELAELITTVNHIMSAILDDENILEEVLELRQKSSDLYEHSVNVCTLSILTALKCKLDQKSIHNLGVGCLLHDIGLRYQTLDAFCLNMSEISKQDMAEYKKHPVYGYDALKNEKWLNPSSLNIILLHHETLDGEGFPVHSKEISQECRIAMVCDTFDEMISGIGCERVKLYEVVEYLKNFKNVKFDGKAVETFLSFIAVYPTGTMVMTNEGEKGIVVRQNKDFQERPVIRITHNEKGEEITGIVIKDLVKVHNIFIEKVLE